MKWKNMPTEALHIEKNSRLNKRIIANKMLEEYERELAEILKELEDRKKSDYL